MKVKITKANSVMLVSTVAALVGMILYIITSVTGYLAGSAVNPWPVICTVVCMALLLFAAFSGERFTPVLYDFMMAAGFVMLLVSFYFFVMGRVKLAADVYFIPVNYPVAEAQALYISLVGVVFYLISLVMLITAGFRERKKGV